MTIPQQVHAGELAGAVVARTGEFIAFLDHEPITLGHTLVCPARKVVSIFELSDAERLAFLAFAEGVDRAIRAVFQPLGITQLMSDGAMNELNHLHLHLVPRFEDDEFTWITPGCRKHSIEELDGVAEKIRGALPEAAGPERESDSR